MLSLSGPAIPVVFFFFILFVVANCGIHLHFTRKRTNLLLSLEGTSYDWITNVENERHQQRPHELRAKMDAC